MKLFLLIACLFQVVMCFFINRMTVILFSRKKFQAGNQISKKQYVKGKLAQSSPG